MALVLTAAVSILGQPAELEPPPSVAAIDQRLAETSEDPSLDDATRAAIRGLYQQGLSELEAAARWRMSALDFARRTTEAPAALAELEAAVATPPPGESADQPADDPVLQWSETMLTEGEVATLEQETAHVRRQLGEAASVLAAADAEPLRRTSRRAEIRETLTTLVGEVADIETAAGVAPATDQVTAHAAASRALLASRRLRAENQTMSLQRELEAYDAERPLLPHRRELAARAVAGHQARLSELEAVAEEFRRLDASQQANTARLRALQVGLVTAGSAGNASQVLLALARANNDLAERRVSIVRMLDDAEGQLNDARMALADLGDRFERARDRVTAVGQTGAVGLMLQRHRATLPAELVRYVDEGGAVQRRSRLTQEEMFDLDEQRVALADLDARAADLLAAPEAAPDEPAEGVVQSVRGMLETQRTYLGLLFDDQARYFDTLVELGSTYGELSRTGRSFLRFIDERVLWTRNAELLSWTDAVPAYEALGWLVGPTQWASLSRGLSNDAARSSWPYAAMLGVVLAAALFWRRTRSALAACGRRAATATTRQYVPTVQGLLLTLATVVPGPALAWLLARRFEAVPDDSGFVQALGAGFASVAVAFLPLEFLRQSARPHGLMAAHFLWPARAVARLRRQLNGFAASALPLVLLLGVTSGLGNQAWEHSLGRIALLGLLAASAVLLVRVLHPARGVFAEALAAHRSGWANHLRSVWYVAAVCLPVALAGVALAGYVFAAEELLRNTVETLWLATLLLVAYGMVSRWVLISRRTLTFRQRRERARAEDGDAVEPGPDLVQLDANTRHFIRTLCTVAALGGVWLVWSDVVPALSALDQVPVWPLGADPSADGTLTLEHAGLALLIGVLTAALARNVPALLEMLLLQLPMLPGSRYALTTMSRYALVFVGVLVVFGLLGVTWSSVQWLVAAIGVGLGFGLQEIFANVVSGLLLLVERPVRIGDTITVGGVTGTVTKIRIRATTIQDWDFKELVVPNKDLVTGHLLNWTLSDAANRVTVIVGVAYESDADQVTRVLREIAAAEPLVLETPAPKVTFEEFGDSALKFSIRAFVQDVEERLPAIHALHLTIARRFRAERIEIAFPQMDIHVRSTAPQPRNEAAEPLRVAGTSR